jgi:Tol biopolymer transport system component
MYLHFGVVQVRDDGRPTYDSALGGLWAVNRGTNKVKQLCVGEVRNIDISYDGTFMAFQQDCQIFTADISSDSIHTSTIKQLTDNGLNSYPSLSPGGDEVAYDNFNVRCSVGPSDTTCGIFVMGLDGSERRLLVRGKMPDWSPDGRYAVYRGLKGELFRINVTDTTEVDQLTTINVVRDEGLVTTPRYSYDGTKIVFWLSGGSKSEIWMINADGSGLHKLTDGMQPDWSRDDREIVFTYSPPDDLTNSSTVWVIKSDKSGRRQLTFGPN